MNENRSPLYLLTGLILGIVAGLVFSLVISPAVYVDTAPSALSATDQDIYRSLIALAYSSDGNLERALQRLQLLQDADIRQALAEQAQRLMADPLTRREARALAELSVAIQQTGINPVVNPSAAVSPTAGSVTPFATLDLAAAVSTATPVPPTATLPPTMTPRPTFTRQPTLNAPYILVNREEICNVDVPLIQVWVTDASGEQMPGMRVDIFWADGSDFFYTGLYPQVGLGYADFEMTPEVSYSLRVGESGQVVEDLTAPECTDSNGSPDWGGWKLEFSQP